LSYGAQHLCCDESKSFSKLSDIFVSGRNVSASNKIQHPVSLQNVIPSVALRHLSLQLLHMIVTSSPLLEILISMKRQTFPCARTFNIPTETTEHPEQGKQALVILYKHA
jgi:hypothetical protein